MTITDEIDRKLKSLARNKSSEHRMGIKVPVVRKLSSQYFAEIKDQKKNKVFTLCQKLLDFGHFEHQIIAFDWAYRLHKQYEESDFRHFKRWSKNHIVDWVDCDDLCTRSLGCFLYQFPQHLTEVRIFSESDKWTLRRISAVALIYSIRRKRGIREAFMTVNSLVEDKEDLVQKGYAWLLRETSLHYPQSVSKYLTQHREQMPASIYQRAARDLK